MIDTARGRSEGEMRLSGCGDRPPPACGGAAARRTSPAHSFPALAVLTGLMLAYALAAGTMALVRHRNLESQALDMGYADQVTWNTSRGRPFRFTVFRGQVGNEAGR